MPWPCHVTVPLASSSSRYASSLVEKPTNRFSSSVPWNNVTKRSRSAVGVPFRMLPTIIPRTNLGAPSSSATGYTANLGSAPNSFLKRSLQARVALPPFLENPIASRGDLAACIVRQEDLLAGKSLALYSGHGC